MKTRWGAAMQIAAVYVGTVVGAGFATGKEIVEFFSRFGLLGFFSILMSGYLLIFLGSKLMRMAAQINAKSYQEFNQYLFGKWTGTAVNILMLIMLLGVSSVMLSGAGAVFEEQLGSSKTIGVIITIAMSMVVMLIGTKALFAVNTFVVPMMITFSFMLMTLSLNMPGFTGAFLFSPEVDDRWKVFLSPFSYTALNLALAQAVLVPIASEIKDDWVIKWGGILGGAALTMIMISSHITLIMLPNLQAYEIPMAIIMKSLSAGLYWIFVLIIYGEIFTSVIGNVFGLERQIRNYVKARTLYIVSTIFIVAYFISLIDYGTLLSVLYPIFGYASLLFLFLLWKKPLLNKK
ncbi:MULTISPECIES: hypothetical protein [unclassified Bacillus (in: firmicutes)]|uniref:YkvI family membrane protein n=1 Tax=unclassified Bacillus (in: firmicutes) TaxID=185979 RepID=UPI0008F07D50|nr:MULTISPECIES: hypothetical protein [unclassified Bacillus (in: firmicutes)]SFA77043.1 Uncharacterized membrane protein YkvI [Bacillus sp. UNCCL13]SFQ66934.1 Uncharacterized membrane protein YkvI [Bacillus sp. cl95]